MSDADSKPNEPVNDVENEQKPKKKEHSPVTPGFLFFTAMFVCSFGLNAGGISIGMMDSKVDNSCIAIWGIKPNCYKTHFKHLDWDDWKGTGKKCDKGDSLVQAAQAFSVMAVIGAFLVIGVCILQLIGFAEFAVVAGIIASIATTATIVVWSSMTALYWANLCGVGVFADDYKLGVGLILFISSWCGQMAGLLVLILDIYLGNSK